MISAAKQGAKRERKREELNKRGRKEEDRHIANNNKSLDFAFSIYHTYIHLLINAH